ncbi:hypothetical protein UFOVP225_90 [uncultured Caudovirales phage]|uniref:Uncharacterized protein n=1 Tax=uncultured Caudovirales phage TaxID=2100421 RepID=A0A6J5L256_9CAUD|nr:hypothetical protein UFOVP113_103 [uncultured Caudovirales phage]CAB5219578.1 hypothetical protein UFOVP225_90 [uncultured Caudovirales phage]
MFLEMSCACGAAVQIDGLGDTYMILMGTRFAESHVGCGFMTPLNGEGPKITRREPMKPRIFKEDDED